MKFSLALCIAAFLSLTAHAGNTQSQIDGLNRDLGDVRNQLSHAGERVREANGRADTATQQYEAIKKSFESLEKLIESMKEVALQAEKDGQTSLKHAGDANEFVAAAAEKFSNDVKDLTDAIYREMDILEAKNARSLKSIKEKLSELEEENTELSERVEQLEVSGEQDPTADRIDDIERRLAIIENHFLPGKKKQQQRMRRSK